MLRYGVDINICDENGESFFNKVSKVGFKSIVEFLLYNVVNVNLCDKNGEFFLYKVS